MVLLGLISGRSTGTRLAAFSKLSLKFRVTVSPARTLPVPVSMAVWAIIWPLAHASSALAAIALRAKPRRGDNKEFIGSTHGDDGARAVAPSNDVQKIRQGGFALGGGAGLTRKAQAVAHPLAGAVELQVSVQRAQRERGRLAALHRQPVA